MVGPRLEKWLRDHVLLVDGTIAALLLVVCIPAYLRFGALHVGFSIGLLVPLVVRRRYPTVAAAIVLDLAFVQWLVLRDSAVPILQADVAVPTVVYAVAAYGPRWAERAAFAAGLTGALLVGLTYPAPTPGVGTSGRDKVFVVGMLSIIVAGSWAFGRLRGARRAHLADLMERNRLLEVERDQRARLAVSAERARIAREMHDVVAHSLAVMIAQADGGRYTATESPRARVVLETIGETGRQALTEMRRLLTVLREESPEDASGDSRLGPQPGIGDLADLVERVRAGGLAVRLRLPDAGVASTTEPGVGLAAYRIVQEGLTNVIKHAGPAASAEVVVSQDAEALRVSVLDDGRGAGQPAVRAAGHGILGMRERVATFGGSVDAGPRPGGGYAVRAVIPAATR